MIKIQALGTGSGKPTLGRSASCTALFHQGKLILFDCGEGTQVQLSRSDFRPGAVHVICITHFHGDHINGLPGFLGTLHMNQRTEPLTVIGPKGLKHYLNTLIKIGVLGVGYHLNIVEIQEPGVVYKEEGFTIAADRLKHRVPCWGYRFVEEDRPGRFDIEKAKALGIPPGPIYGRLQRGESVTLDDGRVIEPEAVVGPGRRGLSVAYCLDTSPCDGVIRLGAGVDLLIHEGTYEPGEEKLAKGRGHSSMLDAAVAAKTCGAAQLLITHLSPKYLRTDGFLATVKKTFENAHIAKDLDVLELGYCD